MKVRNKTKVKIAGVLSSRETPESILSRQVANLECGRIRH